MENNNPSIYIGMTSKEKQAEMESYQIEGILECVYTAICDRCGAQKDSNNDSFEFAASLQKAGWRTGDDVDLLCPKCAKLNS